MAVTIPFSSDTLLLLLLLMNAVSPLIVEKFTVLPLTVSLLVLNTMAVRSMVEVVPTDEGIWVLLASNCSEAAPGITGAVGSAAGAASAAEAGLPPAPPEPQPARTASVTAKKSDAETLEISRLESF
ncbi:MAG: hypothetical protein ACTS5I_04205 [Rhodanobacter sp.]